MNNNNKKLKHQFIHDESLNFGGKVTHKCKDTKLQLTSPTGCLLDVRPDIMAAFFVDQNL